jgi:hypothetical protein
MTAEASSDDISRQAYWSKPPEAVLAALGTSPNGLTSADAAQRLERYGPNALKARRKDTALALFLSQFKSPIIMILLFATLISIVVGDLPDAIIILVIVLGSAASPRTPFCATPISTRISRPGWPTCWRSAPRRSTASGSCRSTARSEPPSPSANFGNMFSVAGASLFLAAVGALVAAYFLSAELLKRWFYRRMP